MKTLTFEDNLAVISNSNDTSKEAYFQNSLSVKLTNNQTLEVKYQGAAIFVMSSNPNSPYAGNNVNGTTEINSAYQDVISAIKAR